MFNRKLRTRLDLVTLTKFPESIEIRNKRNFEVGEKVIIKNYRAHNKWVRAVIQEKRGNAVYLCKVGAQIWKRHTNQIWTTLQREDEERKREDMDEDEEIQRARSKREGYNIHNQVLPKEHSLDPTEPIINHDPNIPVVSSDQTTNRLNKRACKIPRRLEDYVSSDQTTNRLNKRACKIPRRLEDYVLDLDV
ncbi:hypothetical protein QE152_g18968 [Popillia japonica]|uniref:Uncharacterized protein n=1 Tax=Popillia japonica TaxID=7064 RepID=A0AAW1KZ33_POPJA